jgi:hypothetical protein
MRTLPMVLTVVLAMVLSGCEASRESREGAATFSVAADQMIAHLGGALADFQTQVRTGYATVQVAHKDGRKGGAGAFSWGWLVALLPLLVWRARRRAALGDDQDAEASAPQAHCAAHGPAARSGMRRPRTARSARAIPMRVPRLSVRN